MVLVDVVSVDKWAAGDSIQISTSGPYPWPFEAEMPAEYERALLLYGSVEIELHSCIIDRVKGLLRMGNTRLLACMHKNCVLIWKNGPPGCSKSTLLLLLAYVTYYAGFLVLYLPRCSQLLCQEDQQAGRQDRTTRSVVPPVNERDADQAEVSEDEYLSMQVATDKLAYFQRVNRANLSKLPHDSAILRILQEPGSAKTKLGKLAGNLIRLTEMRTAVLLDQYNVMFTRMARNDRFVSHVSHFDYMSATYLNVFVVAVSASFPICMHVLNREHERSALAIRMHPVSASVMSTVLTKRHIPAFFQPTIVTACGGLLGVAASMAIDMYEAHRQDPAGIWHNAPAVADAWNVAELAQVEYFRQRIVSVVDAPAAYDSERIAALAEQPNIKGLLVMAVSILARSSMPSDIDYSAWRELGFFTQDVTATRWKPVCSLVEKAFIAYFSATPLVTRALQMFFEASATHGCAHELAFLRATDPAFSGTDPSQRTD